MKMWGVAVIEDRPDEPPNNPASGIQRRPSKSWSSPNIINTDYSENRSQSQIKINILTRLILALIRGFQIIHIEFVSFIHSCHNRLRQYFTILVLETSTLYSYLLFQKDIYNICIFLDPSDALLRSYAFSMSLPLRQNLLKSNSGNFEN